MVQVTANDPGVPVQGGQIDFTAPASGASSSLSSANPVTIGADGTAMITATADGTAGSYEVTASTAGAMSPAMFDLTNATSTNAPVITLQPVSQTVVAGATASFTATASGSPTPTVQWQLSTDGGVTFSDISGATADTYSFTAAAGQNSDEYRAVLPTVMDRRPARSHVDGEHGAGGDQQPEQSNRQRGRHNDVHGRRKRASRAPLCNGR